MSLPAIEILVLGDGAYVTAVLNAVSSVNSYNVLGAIGAMIGLLLMLVKGVTSPGGASVNPASFLVSIVLFWVMFVPRVDQVVVQETMIQPGNVAARSFVVDNVPAGLAMVGFAMSKLGNAMTQIYETNFGSAEDSARGMTGGLGRNLALLTQMRTMMANPNFTDPSSTPLRPGYIANYRSNMADYLVDCTFPQINHGNISREQVMTQPGLTGVLNDTTGNPASFVRWQNADGKYVTVDCRTAKQRLEQAATSPAMTAAYDRAVEAAGKSGTARDIQTAFGGFTNDAAKEMGTMVATSIMNSVIAQAAVRGSLSPADSQAVIMVEEAAMRRNVQFAGEESLFIRILRPIVGFFEAMFYALGPIMAFVCTLGPFGWGMVGKYMALTIWVGLWFPMLAITQLYSNVQMKTFFELLGAGEGDFTPMQLIQISSEAQDALGAASALAAATPALAMSILFGGAVSMSYLAGRLQGSDQIDENKVAPTASSVSPIASMGSAVNGSLGAGNTVNGGSMPTVSAGAAAQQAESFGRQATQSKAMEFSRTLSESVSQNAATSNAVSQMVSSGWTQQHTEQFNAAVSRAAEQGTISNDEAKALTSLSQDQQSALSVGVSVAGTGAKKAFTDGSSDTMQYGSSAARSAAAKLAQSQQASTAIALNTASAMQNSSTSSASVGLSASLGEQLSNSAKEAVQASETYQQTSSLTRSMNTSESLTYAQMGENFKATYGAESGAMVMSMQDKLYAAGLGDEYEKNLASYQARGGLVDSTHQRLAAAYDTLEQTRATGANADELLSAQSTIIQGAFNRASAGSALGANEQVGEGRGFSQDVDRQTSVVAASTEAARDVTGPGTSAGAVFGAAGGSIDSVGAEVQAGHDAQPDGPANGQLGYNEAQQRLATAASNDVNFGHERSEQAVEYAGGKLIGDVTRLNNNWEAAPESAPGDTGSPVDALNSR